MMRPFLAFIMPRRHALLSLNNPVRFVAMTSSHSSCFMRIRRLSLVMPALFTKMLGLPSSDCTSFTAAWIDSSSTTLRAMPRPLPSSAAVIPSAPPCVVAVPMTAAPAAANAWAMDAPMPREAPVTSAISPFSASELKRLLIMNPYVLIVRAAKLSAVRQLNRQMRQAYFYRCVESGRQELCPGRIRQSKSHHR